MSQPIRILHVTSRADFGGGPEHLFQVLRHSPKQWKNFVACPLDEPYAERYQEIVGPGQMCIIPHRKFSFKALWRMIKFVRKHKIALVHSHGKGAGVYTRIVNFLTNTPCIHTFHGIHMNGYSPFGRKLYRWYEHIMGKFTQRAIAVSPSEQQCLLHEGFVGLERLACIPNGVVFPESGIELNENEPLYIVSITRFDKQKHTDLIIPILHCLKEEQQLHRVRVRLIGDGPGKEDLQKRLQSEGLLQYVSFTGNTRSVEAYLKSAYVYLSTSCWEGLPLGMVEAMSYGLPVVATDVIGNRDAVVEDVTGLLYPDDDAYGACNALLKLINSPRTAKMFGQAGRERVRKLYSMQQMIASLMLIYDDCIAKYGHYGV